MSVRVTETPLARVGFVGTRHPHVLQRARILEKDERVEIVGFFEQDDELAGEVANRLGLARMSSLDSLLGAGIDIAIVEALDNEVPLLARACIGQVTALLLEKPGAHLPQAAYELVPLCRENGTLVEFGYEMHYGEFMAILRRVLASDCLGQVTLARWHCGSPVGCGLELWQSLPEDLGGVGYTEGCHVIELATDLFGVPEAVSALIVKLPAGENVSSPFFKAGLFSSSDAITQVQVGTCAYEDLATTTLIYEDKLVTVDLTAWEGGDWVRDWAVQIYGTNGTATVAIGSEHVTLTLREERGGFPSGRTTIEGGHAGLGYMYERQLDALINRTLGLGAGEDVDLEAGIAVLRVLEATYDSAAASGAKRRVRGPV